jgi:hypothetical protein
LNKRRRIRWVRYLARGGKGHVYARFLVGKPEGKSPLGRPRRRWNDYFKIDLKEVGWRGHGLE